MLSEAKKEFLEVKNRRRLIELVKQIDHWKREVKEVLDATQPEGATAYSDTK